MHARSTPLLASDPSCSDAQVPRRRRWFRRDAAVTASYTPSANEQAHIDELLAQPLFPPLFVRPPLWLLFAALFVVVGLALLTAYAPGAAWLRAITGAHDAPIQLLLLASIPLVSILFTYFHIWLALWMTFFPSYFVGCCRVPGTNFGLGWEGIVFNKRVAFAEKACEMILGKLMPLDEMLSRLDATKLAACSDGDAIAAAALQAAASSAPRTWAALQGALRQQVDDACRAASPRVVEGVLRGIRADREIFSLERLVVRALAHHDDMTAAVFVRCGWEELKFVRNFGATIGGLLGLVQMGVWAVYRARWILPVFGLVGGAATNWLALLIIFWPAAPLPLCPSCCCGSGDDDGKSARRPRCALQGLFLRRQAGVATVYARHAANTIVSPRRVIEEILYDRDRLRALVRRVALAELDALEREAVDGGGSWLALARRLIEAGAAVADDAEDIWAVARERAAEKVAELLPDAMLKLECEAYVGEALDLEATFRERLIALPPEDFESLLHSVFKADEWKLVALGGVLGVLIGVAQAYLLDDAWALR